MYFKTDWLTKLICGLAAIDVIFGPKLWLVLALKPGWENILTGITGFTLLLCLVFRTQFLKRRDAGLQK